MAVLYPHFPISSIGFYHFSNFPTHFVTFDGRSPSPWTLFAKSDSFCPLFRFSGRKKAATTAFLPLQQLLILLCIRPFPVRCPSSGRTSSSALRHDVPVRSSAAIPVRQAAGPQPAVPAQRLPPAPAPAGLPVSPVRKVPPAARAGSLGPLQGSATSSLT